MLFDRRRFVSALPAVIGTTACGLSISTAQARQDPARSVSFTPASELEPEERKRHERYMSKAFELARASRGGPFACVMVDRRSGEIVCSGTNRNRSGVRIQHAEIVTINSCATEHPDIEWRHMVCYTTAEPCTMCASAIVFSRISKVVYGTSIETLANFGSNQIRLDAPTVAAAAPSYSGSFIGGILAEQTDPFYREWMDRRRHR